MHSMDFYRFFSPKRIKIRTYIQLYLFVFNRRDPSAHKSSISRMNWCSVLSCILWLRDIKVLYFLWFSLETKDNSFYQFWSWSSPLWSGPPMHAICCRLFQSCSSSISMLFINKSVSFTICVILLSAS